MVAASLITTRAGFASFLLDARARVASPNLGSHVAAIFVRQLDFMHEATKAGRIPAAEEAAKIDIGPLSVRHLEETDWELARQLQELDYWFGRYAELAP